MSAAGDISGLIQMLNDGLFPGKVAAAEQLAEMGLMIDAGAIGFTDDGCGVQDASSFIATAK